MWSITCPWPMRRPPRAFGSRYGALVIDSMPPATITSALPAARMSCASIAAFIPEPHILFTVVQPVPSGSPAPSDAWRAGAWPWPAGKTQPMITSLTSSAPILARSTAARIAAAPSSGAAKLFSSPWNAAIGVRAAETMTMGSLCMVRSSDSESGRQIVRAHEGAAALQHLRGQGTGLARLGIHRNAGEDADGRDFAALRVAHLVHEARDLLPRLEERGAHRAAIGFDQLGAHALSAKSSRPISQRRISEVPAPIS